MRVAIDLLIVEKERGGMIFATRALIEGLARVDTINEYIIITARPQEYQALAGAANIRIYPLKLRSWRGILVRHQLLLPDALRKLRPDVLHVPAFAAPIGWHGPLVLTVHDLAFLKVLDQSSLYARLYWQYLLRESARRAQRIIAISARTHDELTSYWAIEKERIRLIHNALRPSLISADISPQEVLQVRQRYGERYLLHPGRIMPRKNVERLVQAFELLAPQVDDLHLVLTGGAGYGSKEVLEHIASSACSERIHQTGWVSDHELAALYRGASVLVFPSRHEGFGLPIVEAMACGIPVVASPEAASQEIAGEAVYRTDCSSASMLAEALLRVLGDEELRTCMIQQGHIQAQPFSIEKCAQATIAVYQEALELAQPRQPSDLEQSQTMATTAPSVSIIVPVSRLELASQTLASLARQSYAGEVEIIVVGAIACELAQQWPVTAVHVPHFDTPGKARNLGAARARGEVFLFLDDDCLVAHDWIAQNVHALQMPHSGVVGARICGTSRSFFARCVDFTNFGYYQQRRPKDGPVASASMGVWQRAFQAVGGFDETLSSSEDIDFCYRVQKQGQRTAYRPEIVVSHNHQRDTLGKLLRYNYRRGFAGGLATKIEHRDVGLKNYLLYRVRFPFVFLLLLPLIALLATVQTVAVNVNDDPSVLFYAPFILLGKVAYESGIFRRMVAHEQPDMRNNSLVAEKLGDAGRSKEGSS
jgi:glycosyltransferase involved in cell wall biosynthesis